MHAAEHTSATLTSAPWQMGDHEQASVCAAAYTAGAKRINETLWDAEKVGAAAH